MINEIAKYLKENNLKLSIAESCTGGLISSLFTDVAGASNYIEQNFVTYSPASKIEILGVKPETIERCGVASEEVAKEMAQGLIERWGADVAISTTGVLGPNTESGPKGDIFPGTVFIGFASKKGSRTIKYISNEKTRVAIKQDVSNFAIGFLLEKLIWI